MAKVTPKGVRARLEALAPTLAEHLKEIGEDLMDEYRAKDEDGKGPSIHAKVKIAKAVTGIAVPTFDRGGAPPLKQIQVTGSVQHFHAMSERQLKAFVVERFKELDPADRQMLLEANPAAAEFVEAEVVDEDS